MTNATTVRWLRRALLLAVVGAAPPFAAESAAQGLSGTIAVNPPIIQAGDPTTVTYLVRNDGNGPIFDLALVIRLVDPDTGATIATLTDMIASLPPGGVFANLQPLPTAGLSPKSYLVILEVLLEGPFRLATTTLQVVSPSLDCTHAGPNIGELWPPNHKFVTVSVGGVTAPGGAPVTVTISQVFQDEPTNALGDGNTCPDAVGTGKSAVSVRAERSGTADGRVYHLRFTAASGSGAACQGEVTVCVPHDQGQGPACVDQGPLFNSAVCPAGRSAPGGKALGPRPSEPVN
jgi:hypothetical protein